MLDRVKATAAIEDSVGAAWDMREAEAARGIAEIVDETMASAARVHAVENGKDTAGRTMIAFGGAAPLHAARLAGKLGIQRVVIPPDAGVGSAHGFLDAPIAYEAVRTLVVGLGLLDQPRIDPMFAEMVTAQLHVRQTLAPGTTVTGPALILEDGTTTVIPTGHIARIGADHEIIIEGARA